MLLPDSQLKQLSWLLIKVGIQANHLVPLHHSTAMHSKNQNLHPNYFPQRTIFFFKLHKRQDLVLQIEFLCDLIKNLGLVWIIMILNDITQFSSSSFQNVWIRPKKSYLTQFLGDVSITQNSKIWIMDCFQSLKYELWW